MTYKVPKGWEEVKLGEVVVLNYGKALPQRNRVEGDIPVYSSAGITGTHNEHLVKGPGIIVGRKGTIGTVYYEEKNFYCIDTAFYIKPDKNYHFKYLYYLLLTLGLENLNTDTAVPGLNRNRAYAQNVLLPPLPEQKAIADTLSAIDDKIELNNKINQNLEAQAQAIFKSWFIDFEPFQDGEFVESELGMIPKGWEVVKLEEISTVQNGFAFKSKDYVSMGCPVIRTLNIDNNFVNTENLEYLPMEFYESEKYEKYSLEKFDTLLVMVGATIGKIGMILDNNIPALQNQNMWRFRPLFDNISPFYIHYQVHKINKEVSGWDSGSARSFYRKGIFQDAKIALPKKEIMARFHNITSRMFEIININQQQNQTLSQLRDTLLPKLISGEIRIPLDK